MIQVNKAILSQKICLAATPPAHLSTSFELINLILNLISLIINLTQSYKALDCMNLILNLISLIINLIQS